MDPDNDIRNRVMATAREEFFKFGFSRVTIDEIASKMGMSKKTIYKYFESKEAIVHEVTKATLDDMVACCEKISQNDAVDFVEKLRQMMTLVALQYSKMGKPLIEDLQKNAPHVWKQISEFRQDRINKDFGNLLREGMRKGMFRSDIDEQLILLIYSNAVQTIINPETLMNLPFSAAQLFDAIVKVIYEGILTDEAKQKYVLHKSLPSLAQQRV
jgi:AcrR family transcriptional regulator